jgi:hypothetical protein
MRSLRHWTLTALAMTMGCAVYTSGIRPDAGADPRCAYLYGRFVIKAEADEHGFGGKQSIGLKIGCENGSSYTFGSRDKPDIQVLEIKPSRCWLTQVLMADQNGVIRQRIPVDRALQRPLDFAAGHAYYLGDYFAKGDFWVEFRGLYNMNNWQWAWSSGAGDRYRPTTADMRRTFPNLATFPEADLRLIPEPPRKRGNGIGASVEEPSMSPDRVSVIAPFINRSYATPAQCEAACPTGQCLPYRGASGAAMACVTRCDADSDCPQGLACNCPNREKPAGPACQPIATTPHDVMARICLSPAPPSQVAETQAPLSGP